MSEIKIILPKDFLEIILFEQEIRDRVLTVLAQKIVEESPDLE